MAAKPVVLTDDEKTALAHTWSHVAQVIRDPVTGIDHLRTDQRRPPHPPRTAGNALVTTRAANNQQGDPTVQTYRAIYRGGSYLDLPAPSAAAAAEVAFDRTANQTGGEPVVAVLDLDVLEGGDAYQLLAHTFAGADDVDLGRARRDQA